MRKALYFLLALTLLFSLPITAAGASNLTTEQKFEVLKQKGIFSGFSDGSSRLYQSMTREQFAQVLFKLFELPEPQGSPSYSDVIKTRWSYKPVEAVTKAGLMVGVGNRKFGPTSPVTVEQLSAVLVRGYGFSGDGNSVSGKVSKWARASVGIALQKDLIPKMNDYTLPATRGLLVEAAYAVYDDTKQEPLRVSSLQVVSNQQLRVYLQQAVSSADKQRFMLQDILGVNVDILKTSLSSDGLTVTLTTERQANRTHTLYVDGVPYAYAAPSEDTVKPTVASMSRQLNSVIEVVFSEPVDRDTATKAANYSFNSDLKLTSVYLADDNRRVIITTSKQNDNTTYRMWIRNVKDIAGNKMAEWTGTFQTDNSVPKAAFDIDRSNARIKLTFNEKVNAAQAGSLNSYSIDNGVAVTRADAASDGKTVYLTTSAQKNDTVYKLTVSGIRDLAGHAMETQSFVFAGVEVIAPIVELQSITAVNQNSLEVTFNRTISDADVSGLKVVGLTDNNGNYSMKDWTAYNMRKGSTDRTVLIQYRNAGADPQLFLSGHAYVARIAGVARLITADNADHKAFAGSTVPNPDPRVTQVVALSNNLVKVVFSEPVRNINQKVFMIANGDGDPVPVSDDGVNHGGVVVTEVVLRLQKGLTKDDTYTMTFRSGITDAPGWNGMITKDVKFTFHGV